MKVIFTSKSKIRDTNSKSLCRYWTLMYGKEYASNLVGSDCGQKTASGRKEEVYLSGTLCQTKDGFVYVDISNDIIHGLFALLKEDGIEKPPYWLKKYNAVGAHITVMYSDEIKEKNIEKITEIGSDIDFKLGKVYSVDPDGWNDMERVWFVAIESPRLEKIRKKYNLAKRVNGTHEFHITFAIKKKK